MARANHSTHSSLWRIFCLLSGQFRTGSKHDGAAGVAFKVFNVFAGYAIVLLAFITGGLYRQGKVLSTLAPQSTLKKTVQVQVLGPVFFFLRFLLHPKCIRNKKKPRMEPTTCQKGPKVGSEYFIQDSARHSQRKPGGRCLDSRASKNEFWGGFLLTSSGCLAPLMSRAMRSQQPNYFFIHLWRLRQGTPRRQG